MNVTFDWCTINEVKILASSHNSETVFVTKTFSETQDEDKLLLCKISGFWYVVGNSKYLTLSCWKMESLNKIIPIYGTVYAGIRSNCCHHTRYKQTYVDSSKLRFVFVYAQHPCYCVMMNTFHTLHCCTARNIWRRFRLKVKSFL